MSAAGSSESAERRAVSRARVWLAQRPLTTTVIIGFTIWVVLLLLAHVLWVLMLIVIAGILASAIMPVVRWIRRAAFPPGGWRVPRWTAVLIIYAVVVAILGGIVYLGVSALAPEITRLITSLPSLLQGFISQYQNFVQSTGLSSVLPSSDSLLRSIESYVATALASLGNIGTLASDITIFFVGLFFLLILTVFLVQESDAILAFWISLFPVSERQQVFETTSHVGDKVGYWILGQLTVAFITGVLAGLGIWVMGLPYPLLIGIGTFLLDLAPIVGVSVMAFPAGLLGLGVSPVLAGVVVFYFLLLGFLDGHVWSPLITGRFVRLRITLVVIAIPMGLAFYGALGALIAIPITAGIVVVTEEVILPWLRNQERIGEEEKQEDEERDRAA